MDEKPLWDVTILVRATDKEIEDIYNKVFEAVCTCDDGIPYPEPCTLEFMSTMRVNEADGS